MKTRNVLIVDDSPVSRKILKSCLPKDREFSITEAGDGSDGLARFKESAPEVTFLDLTMPRMDGLECLAEMKALQPRALVVVVTADVQTGSVNRALELGAVDVLRKPASKEAVSGALARVDALLGGTHAA